MTRATLPRAVGRRILAIGSFASRVAHMASARRVPPSLNVLAIGWLVAGCLAIDAAIRIPLYVSKLGNGDGAGVAWLIGLGAALLFFPLGVLHIVIGVRLRFSALARKLALGSVWASVGVLAAACLAASTVAGFAVLCLLFVLMDDSGIWQIWAVFSGLPLLAATLFTLKRPASQAYFAAQTRDHG